jgi:benzodiazapine receptor
MQTSTLIMLICFIAASFAAASTGAIFRPGEWYKQLDKPRWRPPDWLFAPVWALLYLLIAASGWLVWREAGFSGAALPLSVYALQLLLNAAWTPIFFGLHRPGLALMEISILWGSIVATIVMFRPVSAAAALLLVPYLAWVSFASALNFAIWRRNRATTAAKGAR